MNSSESHKGREYAEKRRHDDVVLLSMKKLRNVDEGECLGEQRSSYSTVGQAECKARKNMMICTSPR
jgi:hypothetical protein